MGGPAADAFAEADADAPGADVAVDTDPTDAPVDIAADASAVVLDDIGRPGPDLDATAVSTTTTIWLHHPQAAQLTLRGDQPPLAWSADLAPVAVTADAARFEVPAAAGILRVKGMRQGAWAIGPNHVVQPGETRHIHPYFDQGTGRRDDFQLPGPFGGVRTVRVLLPPGYDENPTSAHPLLVMHDGQNVFDDQTATFGVSWELDDALQGAVMAGKATEVVVAAVDHAGPQRIWEYTPWADPAHGGGGGAKYVDWVVDVLLPELAGRYRLHPARSERVVGGSSLGGLISLYAIGSRPEAFGGALCMSGAWWWNGQAIVGWLPDHLDVAKATRIWLDAGDVSDGLSGTIAVRDALQAMAMHLPPHALGFHVAKGADHSESAWEARVHLPIGFFFDPGNRESPF